MAVEGHWTVRFAAVAGEKVQKESGGVVTFVGGRLLGGDTWAYYQGTYKLDGRTLALRVDVRIHFTEGGESILGGPLVPYTLVGSAELSENRERMNAAVHIEGYENARMVAILSKVSALE
jgi:hypothetical protein